MSHAGHVDPSNKRVALLIAVLAAGLAFSETLLASGLIWPALEHCLKCSHLFNILDSSGSIGVTERTAYILRVRHVAIRIAKAYVEKNDPSAVAESL